MCLQTEQLSLAGTQLLQIGHVKPVRIGKRASQRKGVAFDANLCLEGLGYGVTLGDTLALAGVCGIELAGEGRFCSSTASGYLLPHSSLPQIGG